VELKKSIWLFVKSIGMNTWEPIIHYIDYKYM
jgi:hypothetical protein